MIDLNDSQIIKLLSIVYILIWSSIVLVSRHDLLGDIPTLAFGIIAILIVLLTYIAQRSTIGVTLCLSLVFIGSFYAIYQAHTIAGSLITYDQHVLWRSLINALDTGHVQPFQDQLRGAARARLIPGTHIFLTSLAVITSLSSYLTMKLTPLILLLPLPIIGATLTRERRFVGALIWSSAVFFISPLGTVSEQLFAIPLFGISLFVFLRYQANRWVIVGVPLLLALAVSHTYTPVIALFCFGALTLRNSQNFRRTLSILLLYCVLFVFWIVLSKNMLFILSGVRLLSLSIGAYNRGLTTAVSRVSIPRPFLWWVGQFIRFVPFLVIGLVYAASQLLGASSWGERLYNLRTPGATVVGIGGLSAFAFPLVLNAGGLERGWIIATLLIPLGIVLTLRNESGRLNIGYWVLATAGAILLTMLRAMLRGDANHILTFGAIVAGVGLFGVTLLLVDRSFDWNLSISRHTAMSVIISCLLIGTMFIGASAQFFSEDARESARLEVGLPTYHTNSEYTTSEFASQYIDGPVAGDRRVFILEEFYRHRYVEQPECYQGGCKAVGVIWFNTYEKMWMGADRYIVPFAFPNGDENLSKNRNRVYSSGNSSVYR